MIKEYEYTPEDEKRLNAFVKRGQTAKEIIREMQIDLYRQYTRWVKDNEADLRKEYGTNYIAIKGNCVIDSDKDKFELASRIENEFRGKIVLISTIDDIINPKEENLASLEADE